MLNESFPVRFVKLKSNAKMPVQAKEGDAGYDLFAVESLVIRPFERKIVPTGIAIEIPMGYYGRVAPRSGLAVKAGIDVMAGVVDCFSADSFLKTLDGEKTVFDLKIGERVFSVNEDLEIEDDKVVAIVEKGEQDILVINTDRGELKITPQSIVYTRSGPKRAQELTLEDEIIVF